jgi:universal stress protein A
MERYWQRVPTAGLEGDVLIMDGMPFQSIVDMARDKKVDLMVTVTHGWTGLTHVLLGSVTEKIVRLAPCPVLVARGMAPVSRQ